MPSRGETTSRILRLEERVTELAGRPEKEVVPLYNSLRTFESDYDKAQGILRTVASAWLIATIGAVGLIIQTEHSKTSDLDPAFAAAIRQALLLFSSLGITSLWYVDQRVYQRLLHATFSLGCWLEAKISYLPPIRTNLFLQNLDITHNLGLYYLAPLVLLGLAALVNVVTGFSWGGAAIFVLHLSVLFGVLYLTLFWPSADEMMPPELCAQREELERFHPRPADLAEYYRKIEQRAERWLKQSWLAPP